MSNLKCPFCQQELNETIWEYGERETTCFNCDITGNSKLWQELIRTRKALDVAVDVLKQIDETRSGVKENLYATNGRTLNAGNGFCWTTPDDIHNTLEQITAILENKNGNC